MKYTPVAPTTIALLLALLVPLTLSNGIRAQTDGSGSELKRPLDLPSGGKGDDEEEEDAPETISFYGGEYEGDGFFWCVDKSGSMGGSPLEQLKAEMIAAIGEMSEEAEFSIVAFSDGHIVWSTIPKKANAANRGSAIAWVSALQAAGLTCLAPAGVDTINISNLCQREHKQIIVLSDGEPNCPGPAETLTAMTGANWQNTPINTIYISDDSGGISFMQTLAAQNNGTFLQPEG